MRKIGQNNPYLCSANISNQDNLVTSTGDNEQYSLTNSNLDETQPTILATITGEPVMPIRLYYTICNKTHFMKSLAKLKCVCMDKYNKFLINYHHETKDLGLDVKHDKIPRNLQPVILAKGKIMGEKRAVIDLSSFERGRSIVEF